MKILLLILVLLAVYWVFRGRRQDAPPASAPAPAGGEDMVACAHCRLHLPRAEAVAGRDGRFYCCDAHRERDDA